MVPTVADRRFNTKYVKNKLKQYKFNVENTDKSVVKFDLQELADAGVVWQPQRLALHQQRHLL